MHWIIVVILLLIVAGTLPTWNHSQNYGYGPSGAGGVILVLFVVWLLFFRH